MYERVLVRGRRAAAILARPRRCFPQMQRLGAFSNPRVVVKIGQKSLPFPDEPGCDALEHLRGGKARHRIVLDAELALFRRSHV
ncbi:MAG: hypothetical protein ACREV4_05115 [Gammaproteobacteria bacterium]